MRSGHIPLNVFLNLMRIKESPLCSVCNSPEDITHFIVECNQVEDIRSRYLNQLELYNGGLNIVLSSPLSEEALRMYSFVRHAFAARDA